MPAVTRELSIEYGSTTVGGTTENLLHGDPPIRIAREYGRTTLEFSFVVTAGNEADFNTNTDNVETAFTTPYQDCRVIQGAVTLLDMRASTNNAGFNARPTITKVGSPFDTGRSRLYQVQITFDTAANASGKSGLLVADEQLTLSPAGVKTLRLSGTWTALTSNDARAQFAAQISSYAGNVQTAVGGGTWELTGDNTQSVDDNDKLLRFDYTYREIYQNQSSGTLNDTDIVGASLVVRRRKTAPGDFDVTTRRLIDLDVNYSTWLDRAQTTDLEGKWDSKILPWIKEHVATVAAASQIALIISAPNFDDQENRITAFLRFQAVTGSTLVQSRFRERIQRIRGIQLVAVWNDNPFARDKYQGPQYAVRTTRLVELRVTSDARAGGGQQRGIGGFGIGEGQISSGVQGAPFGVFGFSSPGEILQFDPPERAPRGGDVGEEGALQGFVTLTSAETVEPFTIGLPGSTIRLERKTTTETSVRADIETTPQRQASRRGPVTGTDNPGLVRNLIQ